MKFFHWGFNVKSNKTIFLQLILFLFYEILPEILRAVNLHFLPFVIEVVETLLMVRKVLLAFQYLFEYPVVFYENKKHILSLIYNYPEKNLCLNLITNSLKRICYCKIYRNMYNKKLASNLLSVLQVLFGTNLVSINSIKKDYI